MRKIFILLTILLSAAGLCAQQVWENMDAGFQPLPASMHVYRSTTTIDGKPNIAWYVSIDLKDRKLNLTTAIGNGERFTPSQYQEQLNNQPLLVMNTTFFEFVHNSNLNVVIKEGKMLAYQQHSIAGKGKDTLTYRHTFGSAIGIDRKGRADVAWLYTDTAAGFAYASQQVIPFFKDSLADPPASLMRSKGKFLPWKMKTAVGGGPVLLQGGKILITNNEEIKFAGQAIQDKHPRTAMGYTADGKLICMAVEGRFPGKAEGATLKELAAMLQELGCVEALNLDGGGSSCLLVNGKETIQPSDKTGQRPVPAVFIILPK